MRQVNFRLPAQPIAVRPVQFIGGIAEAVIEFIVVAELLQPAANDETKPQ